MWLFSAVPLQRFLSTCYTLSALSWFPSSYELWAVLCASVFKLVTSTSNDFDRGRPISISWSHIKLFQKASSRLLDVVSVSRALVTRGGFKYLYCTISKILMWNLFTCKGTYMIDWRGLNGSAVRWSFLTGSWRHEGKRKRAIRIPLSHNPTEPSPSKN